MNPTGLVPTLEDGDFVLWESNAILRYVCNAYAPDTTLYPQDIRRRASVDRWLDFQQTTLGPPMTTVFIGLVRTPPAQRNQAAIAAAVTTLAKVFAIVEHELSRHTYMVGDELTLADIVLGIFVHRWFTMPIERAEFPALRHWYNGLLQMPIYRTHIAIALS
jgi:glutathione S-transferase